MYMYVIMYMIQPHHVHIFIQYLFFFLLFLTVSILVLPPLNLCKQNNLLVQTFMIYTFILLAMVFLIYCTDNLHSFIIHANVTHILDRFTTLNFYQFLTSFLLSFCCPYFKLYVKICVVH